MASNSTAQALPNPNTPLAFLPPALADQLQISCYVVVASFAAFVWDWLMSLPEEYTMFRNSRFTMPDVTYLLSRIMTTGFCVSLLVFELGSVQHCQHLLYVHGTFAMLTTSSTSLLFFYRVRAVFNHSIAVKVFFGFIWVAQVGLGVLIPLSIDGAHIGTTKRCLNTAARPFGIAPIMLNAVNDTLIFIAITYRILSCSVVGDSRSARARSFFEADGLPRLSKALLQGGQLYYFATIGINIIFVAMILAPGLPPSYHSMLSVANLGLENAMACRVYRAVKLGLIKNHHSTSLGHSIRSFGAPDQTGHGLADVSRSIQVKVDITSTTDMKIRDDNISGKQPSLVEEGKDAYCRV